MFSIRQKREISEAVQKILRDTNHPELPKGEIQFSLHIDGAKDWSWADIRNNGAVAEPDANPWNEMLDKVVQNLFQEARKQRDEAMKKGLKKSSCSSQNNLAI